MNKVKHTAQVQSIRSYLEGIGKPISQVQAHEVLARALGLKNKHALSALADAPSAAALEVVTPPKTLRIDGEEIPVRTEADGPYTVAELRALEWSVDAIIPMPAEVLFGHIDISNEYASNFLTGLDFALEGISYDRLSSQRIYGDAFEAVRVSGYMSEPGSIFEEEADAQNVQFYKGLESFYDALRSGSKWKVWDSSTNVTGTLRVLDNELNLLKEYARTSGRNNDAVNEIGDYVVVVLEQGDGPEMGFTVDQFKYAVVREASFCVGAWTWTSLS